MESIIRDLRFAVRSLVRAPGFTLVGVLTLALGIGATTTVFSVVYGVLFRPLPFPRADRLVQIVQVLDEGDGSGHRAGLSLGQFFNLQEHSTTLSAVGIFGPAPRTLTDVPVPARLNGAGVAPGLFEAVGAQPFRGRVLRPADNEPGAEPVVLLSYRAWRTHFGGREDIVGTRITLEDVPTRVVGIMPDAFTFPSLASETMSRNSAGEIEDAPEFWIPRRRFEPVRSSSDGFSIVQAHAVLKPGVSYERALAEVRSLIGPLPNGKVLPVELVNERVEMAQHTKPALVVFQLGIVLVLLIACVNVVNLLLTRAAGRRRELAVRMALGASRGRLVREGVAEAVVLSVVGGGLGCLLALALTSALRTLPPHIFPRLRDIHIDGIVLGFSLALSVATGLVVGLLSALRVARASVVRQLHAPAICNVSAVPGARLRPSSLLVVGEIAAAVVLLVGGGLLVNSFVRLVSADLGFDARNVVSFQVSLPKNRYPTSQSHQDFYRELSAALRALPDVQAVSAADYGVTGSPIGFYPLTIDGRLVATKESEISYRRVSPDYFKTLRIPVIEGREFRDGDWSPVATKVIVNRSFAQQHFPNASAIGHRIQWSEWKDLEVIGVVADSRERPDGEIPRAFYLPLETGGFGDRMAFMLRSSREPGPILTAARAVLGRVDQKLAAFDAASLEEVLAHSAASPRLYGLVSLWSALVALALAAIGLYGVLAYSVGSRTHEFGIRIALGAEARSIRWQVLRQGLALTLVGLAIGLAGSYASVQALTSLLFGVTARDMTTFSVAAVVLVATAVIACLVPSIRATRVDPVVALRAE